MTRKTLSEPDTRDVSTGERSSGERAGELIIHRPRTWGPGAGRRFRLELDGRHLGDLAYGATVHTPLGEGTHLLRARCWPLIAGQLFIDLAAFQTLRLSIYVGPYGELAIIDTDPRTRPD